MADAALQGQHSIGVWKSKLRVHCRIVQEMVSSYHCSYQDECNSRNSPLKLKIAGIEVNDGHKETITVARLLILGIIDAHCSSTLHFFFYTMYLNINPRNMCIYWKFF